MKNPRSIKNTPRTPKISTAAKLFRLKPPARQTKTTKGRNLKKNILPKAVPAEGVGPELPITDSIGDSKESLRFEQENKRSLGPRISNQLKHSPLQRIHAHAGSANRRAQGRSDNRSKPVPEDS